VPSGGGRADRMMTVREIAQMEEPLAAGCGAELDGVGGTGIVQKLPGDRTAACAPPSPRVT
jgi:hypothetical protein